MLWVDPQHRRSKAGVKLVNLISRISEIEDVEFLCAAARPRAERFLARLGYEKVAETFVHPVEQVPVVPMIRPLKGSDIETIDLREDALRAEKILYKHRDRVQSNPEYLK